MFKIVWSYHTILSNRLLVDVLVIDIKGVGGWDFCGRNKRKRKKEKKNIGVLSPDMWCPFPFHVRHSFNIFGLGGCLSMAIIATLLV